MFIQGFFGRELDRRMLLLEGEGEGGGGGGAGGDPPAGGGAPAGGGGAPPAAESGEVDIAKLPKAAQEYIQKIRGESASERTKRIAVEAERDRLSKEKKDSDDKASVEKGEFKTLYENTKKELDTERTARRAQTIDGAIREAAAAAGILDPDLVTLIKRETVQVTDSGQVAGAREAVEAFKAEKPNLFKAAAPAGGGGGGGGGPTPRGTGPRSPAPAGDGGGGAPKDVGTLEQKEYNAHKAQTLRSLRNVR